MFKGLHWLAILSIVAILVAIACAVLARSFSVAANVVALSAIALAVLATTDDRSA